MSVHFSYAKYLSLLNTLREQFQAIDAQGEDAFTCITEVTTLYQSLEKIDKELADTKGIFARGRRKQLEEELEEKNNLLKDNFSDCALVFYNMFVKVFNKLKPLSSDLSIIDSKSVQSLQTLKTPPRMDNTFAFFDNLANATNRLLNITTSFRNKLVKEDSSVLDENRLTLQTYDKYLSIDQAKTPLSASKQRITETAIDELLTLRSRLLEEKQYLESRRDEVISLLQSKLLNELSSLETYVKTAEKIGVQIPPTISQNIETIRKNASTDNLTSLLSLDNQFESIQDKFGNLIKDAAVNVEHETLNLLLNAGITKKSEVIPNTPPLSEDVSDIATLLSDYQSMLDWRKQVENNVAELCNSFLDKLKPVLAKAGENEEYLRDFVEKMRTKIHETSLEDLPTVYLEITDRFQKEKERIIDHIKLLEGELEDLSSTAGESLDQTEIAQISMMGTLRYSTDREINELLSVEKQLETQVAKYSESYQSAAQEELTNLLEDLETIKPPYNAYFEPVIELTKKNIHLIGDTVSTFDIKSLLQNTKKEIVVKGGDAIENIKYKLTLKVRLAVVKILEGQYHIPKEIQEAVSELNEMKTSVLDPYGVATHTRRMIEIYDHKIEGEINNYLIEEVKKLNEQLSALLEVGIEGVRPHLETLQKLKTLLPAELSEITDHFDSLESIKTDQTLLKEAREQVNLKISELDRSNFLLRKYGQGDLIQRFETLIIGVRSKLDKEPLESLIGLSLDLDAIMQEIKTIIVELDNGESEKSEASLQEKSKYYPTIKSIQKERALNFDNVIYPVSKISGLKEKLQRTSSLKEAVDNFEEIRSLEEGWGRKVAEIHEWHKTLRVFLASFDPKASEGEVYRQVEDIKRAIKETYPKEDISSYLSWAAEELVETMLKKKSKTETEDTL
ncbi:MAG: hypothetical protein ACFFCD_10060 [Promethearchaeota archaeon]